MDATGKFVFPGFIDPHVHIYLPFMGTYAKDTYASASRAALVGGTTTLIEMCCPARGDDPVEAFELWLSKGAESACDYTFHMGVSRFDATTAEAIREITARGVASLKVFLAYKGAFGIDDAELFSTLALAKELGLIVTAHCENETLVSELQRRLLAAGHTGPQWHEPSRPPRVEAEGVHHLMTFAEMTGAHVYCVHTSCREALEAVQAAQLRGVQAWVETVIPYLVLDKSYAELPDFEGAKYVMSPPLRDKSHQGVLWNALRSRLISTVGTDHAPFDFAGQKEMGRGDFTRIPNGIPSVEDRVNLLYTHGVCTGRIDLATFVDAASTQAARLFGLYPRKGTIAVGSDADLVVYDPAYRGTISQATQQMATDYSAFEGWDIAGRPSLVTVRGQIQVREGAFVGKLGTGKFLSRAPTHF
ncbi:MAG TPA: dihydropyrimidinase [Lacipirellulaceae bacterium]|nr:dihydropyrimidinase [Lacipirellulaceae bacterium]